MKTVSWFSCLMICAICNAADPDVSSTAFSNRIKVAALTGYSTKRVQSAVDSEAKAKRLADEAVDRIRSYTVMLEEVLIKAKPGSQSVVPVAEALVHFQMTQFGVQAALKHVATIDSRQATPLPEKLDKKVASFLRKVSEFEKFPIVQLILSQGERTLPLVLAAVQKHEAESLEFRNALYIVWRFKGNDTAMLIAKCQLTKEQRKKAAKLFEEWRVFE